MSSTFVARGAAFSCGLAQAATCVERPAPSAASRQSAKILQQEVGYGHMPPVAAVVAGAASCAFSVSAALSGALDKKVDALRIMAEDARYCVSSASSVSQLFGNNLSIVSGVVAASFPGLASALPEWMTKSSNGLRLTEVTYQPGGAQRGGLFDFGTSFAPSASERRHFFAQSQKQHESSLFAPESNSMSGDNASTSPSSRDDTSSSGGEMSNSNSLFASERVNEPGIHSSLLDELIADGEAQAQLARAASEETDSTYSPHSLSTESAPSSHKNIWAAVQPEAVQQTAQYSQVLQKNAEGAAYQKRPPPGLEGVPMEQQIAGNGLKKAPVCGMIRSGFLARFHTRGNVGVAAAATAASAGNGLLPPPGAKNATGNGLLPPPGTGNGLLPPPGTASKRAQAGARGQQARGGANQARATPQAAPVAPMPAYAHPQAYAQQPRGYGAPTHGHNGHGYPQTYAPQQHAQAQWGGHAYY